MRTILLPAALLAGLAVFLPVATADAEPGDDAATVSAYGIRATKEDKSHVDPELEPIAPALKRSGYNCFRVVARGQNTVAFDKTYTLYLIEAYVLAVTPVEAKDDSIKLVITWIRKERDEDGKPKDRVLQRVPMTLRKGKYFVSGGWRLEEGALMGAVAAR
jgi:hypothetical protein